jgi:hypothetical protein
MIQSNIDTEKMQLYAGIAGAGMVGGAALAVRATSPIYKKDKKRQKKAQGNNSPVPTGDVDVAAGVTAPVDSPIDPNTREGHRALAGQRERLERGTRSASTFADAVSSRDMDKLHQRALDENAVRDIWGSNEAVQAHQARMQDDAIRQIEYRESQRTPGMYDDYNPAALADNIVDDAKVTPQYAYDQSPYPHPAAAPAETRTARNAADKSLLQKMFKAYSTVK